MGAGLLSAAALEAEEREYVQLIKASAERGADMVKQLLFYSRGVDGRRTPLEVERVISETMRMVRETFPRSISTELQLAEGLWQISADPTQIHQVLLNLCVNARDAMAEGGTLTVVAENIELDESASRSNREAKAGPYVVVNVADTGTGIPPEIVDKIFDPFFTTKEVGKGTGLGLSTVLGIVKSHGGFLAVQSRVGEGTQFLVYLPALKLRHTQETARLKPLASAGANQRILVVDDEEAIRTVARRILESAGYQVLTASNGFEALHLFAQQKGEIQAVVLDMWMPFLDGMATLHELEKISPKARVLATSGLHQMEREAIEGSQVVKGFLLKPWEGHDLLAALEAVLRASPSALS